MIKKYKHIMLSSICAMTFSCTEFVNIDEPRTELSSTSVFADGANATAAVVDIYSQMALSGFASGDMQSVTLLSGLSSDEFENYLTGSTGQHFQEFYENELTPENPLIASMWSNLYLYIFKANAVIEGLSNSSPVSDNIKNQLIGEAKFIRGFSFYYLTNLFGNVPLTITTDYRVNATIPRSETSEIYEQIISDFTDALSLLTEDYTAFANERIRANRYAAAAMLARVYITRGEWFKAEEYSSVVIANTSLFQLSNNLESVFNKNSREAILQLWNNFYTNEVATFYMFSSTPTSGILSEALIESFDANDQRRLLWIGSIASASETFYFSTKYNSVDNEEYSTVLRLAEQYLIRAEARAHQGNISGAVDDINVIKQRAGLDNSSATDLNSVLQDIQEERRHEYFLEWGHRWLDLKRHDMVDSYMPTVKSEWQNTDKLYPIPMIQLINNPSMSDDQNPGY